jgi:hypothetical protein
MHTKLPKLFTLLLSLLVLLPTQVVQADTGPKPSMDFTFKQDIAGEPITVISGVLYECEQSDCSDAAPLGELGPQRFYCDTESCGAVAYGFSPYHKIEIQFSDGKTRTSNIFETAGFDSKYTVTIRPDDLLVDAQFSLGIFPRTGTFLVFCACLCMSGLLVVGLAVFLIRQRSKS